MAGITLAQAEARLAEYLDAEAKVLRNQRVEIDGNMVTRADLPAIQAGIELWNSRAKSLGAAAAGGRRARVVRPGW